MTTKTSPVTIPRWVGLLLVISALVSMGSLAWYTTEQQKCNETFAQNLAQYQELADSDRRAAYEFWSSVAKHPNDHKANVRLFQHWVDTFRRSERIRAENPLPPLAVCD